MKLNSKDPRGIKVYDLLHTFFDEVTWGDEYSDIHFLDGFFRFDEKQIFIKTSENFLQEIYDALSVYYKSRSPWGVLSGVRPLKIVHLEKGQGKSEEEIYRGLIERDKLSKKKADLLLEIAENQREVYEKDRDQLSLYLSIPFCPSICSYCCFHTKAYTKKLAKAYLIELLKDLEEAKGYLKERGRNVDCVYIGGGTPWVLEEEDLKLLFDALKDFTHLREFTFEGGRTDVLTEEKAMLVSKHATRVCLNPQTLTEGLMPLMGRPESKSLAQWIQYFKEKNIITSSDLIAGLPGESLEGFMDSLKLLIAYAPDNITVHNLSLKKGASLKKVQEGARVAQMIDGAYEMLKSSSYNPYYIYRQKNMLELGENVGYERGNTACIYNIRMMEDAHEILSLGSNAVSKKIISGRLKRIHTAKDLHLYLKDRDKRKTLIEKFFSDT